MSTSCSHYFRETIRGAERCGLDSDKLISEVGLSREDIFDPHWRGKSELLASLVQLVWIALNDEFMGFAERPSKTGTFAMMCHCIIGAHSLEEAFLKGVRFYELFTNDIQMKLEFDDDSANFHVVFKRPELDPQHYFMEFWLSIWYRLIGWMGGVPAPLRFARFSYPRPDQYIEEFKYMFPCDYQFDASATCLVFDRAHLQLPIVRTAQELKQFLSVAPLGFMTIPADVTSYARHIRTYLLRDRRLPLEFPDFSEVAQQLNMAEQTLRRKLKAESTSYRAIIENIRRDLAIQKLLKGRNSVSDIAEMLGYSETRAFTRAFREWTDMSPMQYRDNFRQNVAKHPSPGLDDF